VCSSDLVPYDINGDGSNVDSLPLAHPPAEPAGTGNHTVTITIGATVVEYIDVSVSPISLSFGSINPLTNGTADRSINVTNTPNSNVHITLTLNGSDLASSLDTIPIGNMRMMANSVMPSQDSFVDSLTNADRACSASPNMFNGNENCADIAVGSTVHLWFNLHIPGGKKAGDYSTVVNIQSDKKV
jgi:hypothetical protein